MRKLLIVAALVAVTAPLVAQQGGRGRGNQPPLGPVGALGQEVASRVPPPTGPAPRLPDSYYSSCF